MEETSRTIHVQFVGQVTFCAFATTANQVTRIIFLLKSLKVLCVLYFSLVCKCVCECQRHKVCVCALVLSKIDIEMIELSFGLRVS